MLSPALTSATATRSFFNAVGTALNAVRTAVVTAYSLLTEVGSRSPYLRDSEPTRALHAPVSRLVLA